MGVTEQLKKLHKQNKIRTSDIPRVVNSGVDVDTYLDRARTLDSYINGEGTEAETAAEVQSAQPMMAKTINVVEETPTVEAPKVASTTAATTTATTTTTKTRKSIIRDL